MTDLRSAGRWIGVAILIEYVLNIGSNFFLQPMIRNGAGFAGLFGGAADQPGLIGTIVLMGIVSGVAMLAMAALLCQISITKPFAWLAFLFLGMKAASFGMGGGELASYQVFRGLGDAMQADPGGQLSQMINVVGTLAKEQRDGLHFPHMLLGGMGAFVFYLLLLRSGWVPRWLAAAGLLATASQMIGVFSGVAGREVSPYFLAPLALVQLVAGLWLVVRGLTDDGLSTAETRQR